MKTTKRLYRTRKPDRIIGGVCGGIGEYFNVDPVFIRILCVVLWIISPPITLVAYTVAWIITPIKKLELEAETVEVPITEPEVVK